jgi:hypothetical protein
MKEGGEMQKILDISYLTLHFGRLATVVMGGGCGRPLYLCLG